MRTEQWLWSTNNGWHPGSPSAQSGLGEAAQVVFLFGSTDEAMQCFDIVRTAYPKAWIFGCTTGGEIYGKHILDHVVTITALAFEGESHVVPGWIEVSSIGRSFEAGRQLAQLFDPRGLRHIFILSEGLQVNPSELVQGVNSALPAGVTVAGGIAGDNVQGKIEVYRTAVWYDGTPKASSAVALGFYGDRLQIGVSTGSGWDAFGPDRLITKAKGNMVYQFEGRSALSIYKQYLGQYAQTMAKGDFLVPNVPDTIYSGLIFPLAVRVGEEQDRVIRAIVGTNEEEQALILAGNVAEGSYARMMRGRIEHLIDGVQAAGESSIRNLNAPATQFSILVSCTGRRYVLKQRTEEELEAVSGVLGEQSAVTGFYSLGEIGPVVAGGQPELHNETMVITTFAEV